jgi:hypothetical protein
MFDRLGRVTEFGVVAVGQKSCKVVLVRGNVGAEANSLPQIRDGLVQAALAPQGIAEHGVGNGAVIRIVWEEANGPPKVGDRVVPSAERDGALTTVAISYGVIRPEGDAGGEVDDGLGPTIDLVRV